MEAYIDRLLATLRRFSAEASPEVERTVQRIRSLSSLHFEKEESVFYPSLRLVFPELLAEMDRQHEEIRELERHVRELLSDPPRTPDSRWLNEVRSFGTELHDYIQHHIVAEEDHLFPLAERRLTTEEQQRLAVEMTKVQLRPPAS